MPKDYFLELVHATVSPSARSWESGIPLAEGRTQPFKVTRGWSGPAGHYVEAWSIRRGFHEVLYEHPPKSIDVRGMQSVTEHTDQVDQRISLKPGTYRLVFVVEGLFMGSVDIEVRAASAAA